MPILGEPTTKQQFEIELTKVSGPGTDDMLMRWHRVLSQVTGGVVGLFRKRTITMTHLDDWERRLELVLSEMRAFRKKHQKKPAAKKAATKKPTSKKKTR